MNFKEIILLICPPLVTKLFSRFRRKVRTYESYAEALENCGPGYDSNIIAKVVVEKNKVVRDAVSNGRAAFDMNALRALSAGLALSDSNSDTLNVLDFGGGGGYHYYFFKSAMGDKKRVRWCVVETPQMVSAAKELESDELIFADSIEGALERLGRVDFVLICGSIQYTPDPLRFLSRLVSLGAERLFVTRTPLSETDKTAVLVQRSMLSSNGPGRLPEGVEDDEIIYPVTVLAKTALEKVISSAYEIQVTLIEEGRAHFIGGGFVGNYGYLCLRK